jgi:UDP-glucose 4-epimerase
MKVLVTGGAGFIGSHIVDGLLAAGHSVSVIDNLYSGSKNNLPPTVPLHVVDITAGRAVRDVFDQEQPDVVCHQAAQMSVSLSVRDPLFDAQVNCIGLINVLNAAVAHKCSRFVFASSGGVLYGDVTKPAPETTPANPISPYGITKWVGERYLKFYAEQYGFIGIALRYSNVYGPRQNPHGEAGVVAIFCKKLIAGEPATINGDGKYIRDYVFVSDVARANILALTAAPVETPAGTLTSLNIGTGIGADVNEIEAVIRQELRQVVFEYHLPAPIYAPARAGDLRSNLVDAAKAGRVLGWRPAVKLATGLQRTARWFISANGV